MSSNDYADALADLLDFIFLIAWIVALAGWAWAFWHFMPMWRAGFKKNDAHRGYPRKVLVGVVVFLGAFGMGASAMLTIEVLGLRNG